MAPMLFADAIINHRPIKVFNHGKMKRDFTYIDDIVEGMVRVAMKPATTAPEFNRLDPDGGSSGAPFRVFNIGKGQPVALMDFINGLEVTFGIPAKKEFLDMQPGDVAETFADTSRLNGWVGFAPNTSINEGVTKFVEWYRSFYCQERA